MERGWRESLRKLPKRLFDLPGNNWQPRECCLGTVVEAEVKGTFGRKFQDGKNSEETERIHWSPERVSETRETRAERELSEDISSSSQQIYKFEEEDPEFFPLMVNAVS